jgi:hypothetical protein
MKQTTPVSWRTTGIAICACLLASSLVVFFTRQNTIKPNELASSTAARWLVHQPSQRVVLVDGFSGRVLARIGIKDEAEGAVTVQGEGGAFLVSNGKRTARSISTAKLRLGTSRPLDALASKQAQVGVGANGLTAVDARNGLVDVLSVDASARSIDVPDASESLVAGDGSVWLLRSGKATHVRIDGKPLTVYDLPGARDDITTIGAEPLALDRSQRLVRWLGGDAVSIERFGATRTAVLQEAGPASTCAWLGSGDELACIGHRGIDRQVTVPGLGIDPQTRFAVVDATVVVVRADNSFERFDIATGQRRGQPTVAPESDTPLAITATEDVVWIDDTIGDLAWVVQRFGQQTVRKDDPQAPKFDADGQAEAGGSNSGDGEAGDGTGDQPDRQLDDNGVDDKPIAIDDTVTAGADKQTVMIPVTDNDFDPDGDAIAVVEVEPAGHGDTYVLNATTVVYVPQPGRSGIDTFSYSITDQNGNEATAEVSVEIFDADRPNEAPDTRDDEAVTRVGVKVDIDVLANDVDPERDELDLRIDEQPEPGATVDKVRLASGRFAIEYTPAPGSSLDDRFTYVALDARGLASRPTEVIVKISAQSTANKPPTAAPDAVRVRTNQPATLAVLANDIDPDNDRLTLSLSPSRPSGVTVRVVGEFLQITARPGLPTLSTLQYTVTDTANQSDTGTVLVIVDDPDEPNRPPVANQDTMGVNEGGSTTTDLTANDSDPDADPVVVRSVTQPDQGAGVVTLLPDGEVQFTSTGRNLTETVVTSFTYEIADPGGLRATGIVVVTISPDEVESRMVATDDATTVTVGGRSTTINLLTNDTTTAQPMSISGSVRCSAPFLTPSSGEDGSFTVAAGPDATVGPFTCTYRVVDAQGNSDTGTIAVEVQPRSTVNTPPTPVGTTFIRVDAGEVATPVDLRTKVSDEDGDELTFTRVTPPLSPGRGAYDLDGSILRFTAPAVGPVSVTITVNVSDGTNPAVPLFVTYDVQQPTKAPPIAVELSTSAPFGQSARVNWLRGGDPKLLSATITEQDSTARIVNDNGFFTITASDGFVGRFSARYIIRDNNNQTSNVASITVDFEARFDSQPVANADSWPVAAGASISENVLSNDNDLEGPLTARLIGSSAGSLGTAALSRTGQFTFTANPAEDGGVATFDYEATDSANQTSRSTITVTVLPCATRAPTINAPDLTIGLFQRPFIDLNQYVTNGTVDADSVRGGGLTGATGTFEVPAGFEGVETITFTAGNSCRLTASGSLRIRVNRPPQAQAIDRSMGRGSTLVLSIGEIANDDEPLTIDALPSAAPNWVSLSGDRTVITAAPPLSLPSGVFTFTIVVRDPGSGRVDVPIRITVTNQAPVAVPDVRTTEIDTISVDPRVNDSDPEGSGLTIVSAVVRSGGADVAVFEDHITMTNLTHGVVEVNYTIVDDEGATATSVIRIVYNLAPEARNESFVMYEPILEFDLPAEDPDGDPLTVIAAGPDDFTTTVRQVGDTIRMTLRANKPFELGTQIYFFYSVVDPFGATSEAIIFLELNIATP